MRDPALNVLPATDQGGLRRMARANRSIASFGSPSQILIQPLQRHASAKLELSIRRAIDRLVPTPRSRTTNANAHPLPQSTHASSLPSSSAR